MNEIDKLAKYLPHKLKFLTNKHRFKYGTETVLEARGMSLDDDKNLVIEFLYKDELVFSNEMKSCKPILRPMSDLTKEVDYRKDGSKIVFINTFMREHRMKLEKELRVTNGKLLIEYLDFGIVEKLLKYHFDIHSLIEKKLAININTVQNGN